MGVEEVYKEGKEAKKNPFHPSRVVMKQLTCPHEKRCRELKMNE